MRWEQQQVEREEEARLPGYRDAAIVRRFDAPEALETRFYEVHAKSVLNRVPERSRMPFRWTINPYRGCSHSCVYCCSGDTAILMTDGRTRPIEDLRVGDAIVGTRLEGRYRRYVATRVLDHWTVVKPAFAVELEDGTRLVTSGDHRFLTERGWKHVVGRGCGAGRRPHLTTNNALLGTGGFARPPEHCPEYRRGYLCGIVRGDGNLAAYTCRRTRGGTYRAYRFRLSLTDFEALRRARIFLDDADVPTREFVFHRAVGDQREAHAIRTSARDHFERITELVRWPPHPTDAWRKGFLAGIFDAEGSCGGQAALRISNTDQAILGWTRDCLTRFGFAAVTESTRRQKRLKGVRIRGGLRERLRFFHLTDPAITRKRTIDGIALKSGAKTRVVSVKPLGMELPLHDITTGTGDFISNGVVSHNCFARPTHTYLDFDAGRDFEKEIVVKVNAPEVVRAELRRPSWRREHVALGTNTDPYQWVEGRYRLMPPIWEALRDADTPCSVLTKSPLLLRDLALMQQIHARVGFTANLSVPTLDEKAWRATEPHTPHPRARLEAVAALNRAGIPTGVLVAPLMPGLNDAPAQVDAILTAAAAAGATSIGGVALHLRAETKDVFFAWLRDQRPDLLERYERLYAGRAYVPKDERQRLSALLDRGRRYAGARATPLRRAPAPAAPPPSPPPTRQQSLF